MTAPANSLDAALAAARAVPREEYLTVHMRGIAKVNPDAVARILRGSSLSAEQRESVARELGVTL